ncbi:MmcQ/YjbR family DNA-binding protein [Hominifimenecus sp. rT4P-3]|uniref:MmcQ/YjbR family DNA-binding protein n=1 Tax=Hominifimenecus sp. rT4P-3 TaxID=3242979 RepID=UPI003DA34404
MKKKYKTTPEYLWSRFPDYAIFRHGDNNKWYGLIMNIPRSKLGLPEDERTDILNVKLDDPFFVDMLIQKEGYFKGYHIRRGNWISILLDGTVPFEEICEMLDKSFFFTASRQGKQKLRPPKEWLIPANPKYYDIEHAFEGADIINWKQGNGIRKGDTVFMYVGSPISAILYQCKVTETDIPYDYANKNLTIKSLMKIKLLKRYQPDLFPFHILKEKYGISAVRGPRGIPHSLSEALK